MMRPMLAHVVDMEDVDRYINDDEWVAQQKLDGDRIMILADGTSVRALNREGEDRRNTVPRFVLDQFADMPVPMAFDGELIQGVLWLFDLPQAGELVLPTQPYEFRSDTLANFVAGWEHDGSVRLLDRYQGATNKRWLVDEVERIGAEGVVFKRRGAPYRSGKRSQSMLKAKFTKTVDAEVYATHVEGRNNAHVQVYGPGGRVVHIGSVSLNGKPPVNVGDVLEIRYLYLSEDNRLYQPRMIRVRHDKAASKCTFDQLGNKYPSRKVLCR